MRNNDEDRSSIFSIFSGLDKLINVVGDMIDNDKDEMNLKGDIKTDNNKKVIGKYGFNIMLGPDKMSSFQNLNRDIRAEDKRNQPKVVSPVTDIFEEEDKVTIVSELPGVEKDDIELSLDKNVITFTAARKNICYSKQVVLKFIPNYASIRESFHNSIYSVTIIKDIQA